MHFSPTIHYNAGHTCSYKNDTHIIQELMNLLHGNNGRISSLTLSVLMSSVLTNYVSVHVSVQLLVEAHAVEQ